MRPNWFIAFPVSGAFILDLPPLPSGFRRFHPEDVHLTLAFLGPCGEAGAARAWRTLDDLLRTKQPPSLPISLAEVVPMGRANAYSALSALLNQGRTETERLIASLRDPLTEVASARTERRAPKPHVTLARPRRRATADERAAGLVWARSLDLSRVSAVLHRVALYTWSPHRAERLFRVVSERPFDSDAPAPEHDSGQLE